jgi:cytoskeleton protein RodZ
MMTDESTMRTPESELIGFAPLGEVFAAARSAKKLEVKDVSNNLRLSIKQIEALENNDFSSLPQAMITRGFIRNYARLLGVDAEPLLASYRARMPEALPSTLNVQTTMNQIMATKASKLSMKYVVAGMLLLLPLLVWYILMNYLPKHKATALESVVATTPNSVSTVNVALPEVALPAAERLPEAGGDVVEATITNTAVATNENAKAVPAEAMVTTSSQSTNAEQFVDKNLDNAAVKTIEQSVPSDKVAAEDFNTLKANAARTAQKPLPTAIDSVKSGLKTDNSIASIKSVNIAVSEQTWVRVSDKTGAVVFEKMLGANSADGFDGLPPFKLLIGNAKATKLTFLGQQVDLTPSTKNNIAHLTLE